MVKETGKIMVAQGEVLDEVRSRVIGFDGRKPRSIEGLGDDSEV